MPCCIPGCSNLLSEWTTELPRDETLLGRWKAAIQAGTGHRLAEKNVRRSRLVCDMHFQHSNNITQAEYREPTLFVRDKMLVRVVSCRLCMRYETIDTMFAKDKCLSQNNSLQDLADKYFGSMEVSKERDEDGFLCEICVVRIDMTHAFWQDIHDGVAMYNQVLKKMSTEKVLFKNINSALQDPQMNKDEIHDQGEGALLLPDDIIIKEEPQLTESDPRKIFTSPNKQQALLKCYICNIVLESKKTLVHHLVIDHKPQESYRCESCMVCFAKVTAYNSHLAAHDSQKPFKCSACIQSFNRRYALLRHEAAVHAIDHGEMFKSKRSTRDNIEQTEGKPSVASSDEPVRANILVESMKPHNFKCYLCGDVVLESETALIQHLMIDHPPQESYCCVWCNETFGKVISLNSHLATHDTQNEIEQVELVKSKQKSTKHDNGQIMVKKVDTSIQCELCYKRLASISSFAKHLKSHHDGTSLKCKFCNISFEVQQHLVDHVKEKHNEEKLGRKVQSKPPKKSPLPRGMPLVSLIGGKNKRLSNCNVCQAKFKESKDMVTHFKESHPSTELKYRTCEICDAVFFKSLSLVTHRYIHSDTYACDQCGKRHYSNISLTKHRHTVHSIQLSDDHYVNCPVCEKRFIRDTNYKAHLRTHEDVKPFSCDSCDKSFRERPQLVSHQRTHTGERPFGCDSCDKRFRDRKQWRIHQRTHTGERPLVCERCGADFAYPSSYTKHKKGCKVNKQDCV